MKKTLIITLEYPPKVGGIATYVHDLANTLDSQKVIVLAPPQRGDKEWDQAQKYKVIRKKPLLPKFIWPRWIRLCWQVWRLVKKEGIELIMIQHALPVGYVGIIQKKFRKIPFLLFSHGTDLVAGTKSKWKRKMLARVCRHSEQVIFNSQSLKGRFLGVLPEFETKSMVLYPCPSQEFLVEPDAGELESLRAQYALQGKKVILSVSRLDEGKGFPHLTRAMPKILQKSPHLVWLVVGGGPKKDAIVKEVQRLNLQNVTRFVGEVSHQNLAKYYHLADLFVLLTHPDNGREEGLGLVFLEAAAAGLPVVAGRSGGVEEAVLHTQTGVVLDIHTQGGEIVEAIAELLNNQEYADRLGGQAQERIRSSFVWENQVRLLNKWLA